MTTRPTHPLRPFMPADTIGLRETLVFRLAVHCGVIVTTWEAQR